MLGLDPTYKRALQGEMSQSSSSNSLNVLQSNTRLTTARSRQASVTGSTENLIDDHKVEHINNNDNVKYEPCLFLVSASITSPRFRVSNTGQETQLWYSQVVITSQGSARW